MVIALRPAPPPAPPRPPLDMPDAPPEPEPPVLRHIDVSKAQLEGSQLSVPLPIPRLEQLAPPKSSGLQVFVFCPHAGRESPASVPSAAFISVERPPEHAAALSANAATKAIKKEEYALSMNSPRRSVQ